MNKAILSLKVFIVMAFILLAGSVHGQEALNLNGSVDLSSLNMETNQGTISVLNQKYALSCNRSFTPYLSADAALHFSRSGQDFEGVRSFQSELEPMGQAGWNTPWFSLDGHAERHISQSDIPDADLSRDNASFSFRTKPEYWPRLNLGLDLDRMYTPNNLQLRNIYEADLMGGLNWQYKSLNTSYNINEQQTESPNQSTLERRNTQSFRWDHNTDFLNRKLRLRSDYALNYQSGVFEKPDSVSVLEWVPVQRTFYAVDRSPEFSVLDSVSGLLDGNKTAPASPSIPIGPENTDGNIAMDFGTAKEIGAVYLYANQRSLSPGIWTVYSSKARFYGNDMQWEPIQGGVESHFDEAYLRFEITFPNISSQFLKVVFKGTADTGKVLITELEALHRDMGRSSVGEQSSTQIISVNTTYLFTDQYDLSLDMGFQNEPFSSVELKKKMTFISLYPAISAISTSYRARPGSRMSSATSAMWSNPRRRAC